MSDMEMVLDNKRITGIHAKGAIRDVTLSLLFTVISILPLNAMLEAISKPI